MAISLANISKGPNAFPPRLIIVGVPGVGKSTFGAYAPDPIFINIEDGLGNLDVSSFPRAKTYEEVDEQLKALSTEDHQYKTLVFDSLDWFEGLIWDKVSRDNKVSSIEAIPYGKGYILAQTYWRDFIDKCNWLRNEKGMTIIYTAHSEITTFNDPERGSYNRYGINLHKHAAPILIEDVDAILFANYQVAVATDKTKFGGESKRVIGQATRVVLTQEKPSAIAKNRYNLPSEIIIPEGDTKWAALWNQLATHVPYFQKLTNQQNA